MDNPKDITSDLDTLPKKVRDFLLSPKVAEANRKVSKTFVLSRQEQENLMDNEYQGFFKQISVEQFLAVLKSLAEAGKHPVGALQKMVVEELLLPLNDYFNGSPATWMARLEKEAPNTPKEAPPARHVSPDVERAVAGGTVPKMVSQKIEPPAIPKPVTKPTMIASTKPIVPAVIPATRPLKLEERSGKAGIQGIQSADDRSAKKEITKPAPSWPKTVSPLAQTKEAKPNLGFVAPSLAKEKPIISAPKQSLNSREEEKDLEEAREKVKVLGSAVSKSSVNEADLIASALGVLPTPPSMEIQRLRIEQAIKNRWRDIRDATETREFLERNVSLGGGGLTKEAATALVEKVEKIFKENQSVLETKKREEIKALDLKEKQVVEEKELTKKAAEKTSGDKRYADLLAKKGLTPKILEKMPGFLKPKSASSAPLLESPSRMEKTKIEDIKFTPSLVGPLEELKNFTLKDWQTLGGKKDIVAQKLSLLRNESYLKYQTGLANFRQSPFFSLAQNLIDEALQAGKKLAVVISDKKSANEPYLSEGEINDILNVE